MLNPDCTPGEVDGHLPGLIVAICGCGWTRDGFESRSAAFRAQKAHRFPPPPSTAVEEPVEEPRTPSYAGGLAVPFRRPSS